MADDCSSNLSNCSYTRSLTASGVKPQNQISFQEFKAGMITTQKDKPNMTIDLRQPRLIHLYSSENDSIAVSKLNGIGDTPGPSKAVSSPGRHSRPQTARRGGRFHGFSVRGCHRSETASKVRASAADKTGDCGTALSIGSFGRLQSHDDPQSLSHRKTLESCGLGPFVNPKSADNPISNQVSHSVGQTDVIDVTAFAQLDANVPILPVAEAVDTNFDVSNQPSTIIHLKLVAPSSGREETEALVVATSSRRQEKQEAFPTTPCVVQEENLDNRRFSCLSKDSGSFVNPDATPDQNVDGMQTKRKMQDVSDCNSTSDDDDLPLIVHCKRSKKVTSQVYGSKDGRLVREVKRTYERGNAGQHGSGSSISRAEDSLKSVEKRGIVCEKFNGGETVAAGSAREGLEMMEEPWKKPGQSRQSGGSSLWQRQLEEYERNSFARRNATDSKTASGRKVRVQVKTQSDGESTKNSRKPASQVRKPLPFTIAKKTRVLRCLKSGPVSLKRKQMKEFGVNPKIMSQVLRELTERKSSVGRISVSFLCSSHQNYYNGCLVFRLTERLPAKEKVTVHVPARIRDDLDPVGKEALVLWRMSDSEVEELQKQVKQEMEHKRTEHIMPMVLQMSYEQIETAYEQVKKDMKTYEITENDSEDEDEEEDEEEDKQKDDDEEEEEEKSKDKGERTEERGKDDDRLMEEDGDKVEDLENSPDENLRVRSYDIIVHDESSKTVSCETVKYLEWRKKHPSFKNGKSEALDKEKENPADFETGVENDPPIESPNAVERAGATAEQTNYSRSRPKRHAVDYSPNAFAPIRLMEGKRLGGKQALPTKLQNKKKTVNDTRQERQSSTPARDTSGGGTAPSGLKGDRKNHKNGSDGKVRKHESEPKVEHRSQKPPKSPPRELEAPLCDFTRENTVSAVSLESEPSARDGSRKDDVASEDEFPVILDVADMPLSPATTLPTAPKQLPVVCEHDCQEKPPQSEYEVVRNEYMRLRDLTQAGTVDDETVLSDVLVSGDCNSGGDHNDKVCSLSEKLCQEEIKDIPVSSSENFRDEPSRSRESSDLSLIHPEAFAPTQNTTDGGCLANMPSLQRHCVDVLGTEAEEPLAPPDLGLPIECLNSQQRPASPVVPPVLEVEEAEMKDEEDVVALTPSFPLVSSSPDSVVGGRGATALCDSIAGDVH